MSRPFFGTLIIPPSDNISPWLSAIKDQIVMIPPHGDCPVWYHANKQGLVELMRANKDYPDAIQFLADMLE